MWVCVCVRLWEPNVRYTSIHADRGKFSFIRTHEASATACCALISIYVRAFRVNITTFLHLFLYFFFLWPCIYTYICNYCPIFYQCYRYIHFKKWKFMLQKKTMIKIWINYNFQSVHSKKLMMMMIDSKPLTVACISLLLNNVIWAGRIIIMILMYLFFVYCRKK